MGHPSSLTIAIAGAVHAIKRAVQRARYMTLETIAPLSEDPLVKLPPDVTGQTMPESANPARALTPLPGARSRRLCKAQSFRY